MSPHPDGGPAFPYDPKQSQNPMAGDVKSKGLSLRDYFAAEALVIIGWHGRLPDAPTGASIASMAYQVADAMLLERAK